jgi:outer membrane receptor for ferrienterochelin and colicins
VIHRSVSRPRASLVALLAAGWMSAPGRARADAPSDLEAALAQPVVSTASQTPEDQSTAPATITTITAEDLHRYGIKSLDEAINFLSLGMFTQDNLDGPEAGSRGVILTGDYGNHVLLLVNGHAMNEQWGGTAYFGRGSGIPFELIDHIEVIVGPGSVLYGSYAMLGVINIVTKSAKDYSGFHAIAEADLLTSWRTALGIGKEFTLFGKRGEITAQIEYYDQHGPSFTIGPQHYGDDAVTGLPKCFDITCSTPGFFGGTPADRSYYTNLPDGYMRLVLGNFELDLRGEIYKRSYPYEFGLYNSTDSYEADKWLSFDLKHRWVISSIAQLRSRLYGDTYEYHERLPSNAAEDCLTGENLGCVYYLLGVSRWVGLEEQLALDWLHDGSLTTLLGIDPRMRFIGSTTNYNDLATGLNPGTVTAYSEYSPTFAAYLQQTWRPIRWLALNAGARLDEYPRSLDNVGQGFPPRVSPRATAAVNPWHNGTLKVIYSTAFRAPTAYETLVADHESRIPSPDLRPETVTSLEGSLEHRFGSQRILAGVFESKWTNIILAEQPTDQAFLAAQADGLLPPTAIQSQVTQYQNLASIENHGFQGTYEGTLFDRDLRYALNVTGAYSRRSVTTVGSPVTTSLLGVAPQVFGNARISYDLPGALPVLGLTAFYIGRRPADQAFNEPWATIPYAPPQLTLRGTISGAVPWVKGLSYRFMANYNMASQGPYITNAATSTNNVAQLVPVDRFRTTIGLQYDLR